MTFFPPLDISLTAPTNSSIRAPTPTTPLASSSQLRSDNFLRADARIRTATDIPIIIVAAFPAFLYLPPILSNIFIAMSNSPNRAPIAKSDEFSLSESIVAITNKAAAKMAIATAIFLSMSAFKFF